MRRLTSVGRFILSVSALIFLASVTSKADTVFIVGNTHPTLATATITCTFNNLTGVATFAITNTSPFDARITSFGIDLAPIGNASDTGLNGFTAIAPVPPGFTFTDADAGNVNQFNDAVLDFAFLTGANFSGGDPNAGIAPGATVTFSVQFPASLFGLTDAQICDALFVRFQRVGADGELSDVGVPGNGTPVPEPGSIFLLGTGLFGAAGYVRRKFRRQ